MLSEIQIGLSRNHTAKLLTLFRSDHTQGGTAAPSLVTVI